MKDSTSIHENDLEGALNALFLETYSQKEDEGVARFCLEQEYNVTINPKKEAAMLARLSGKSGGGKNILWIVIGLVLLGGSSLVLFTGKEDGQKVTNTTSSTLEKTSRSASEQTQTVSSSTIDEEKVEEKKSLSTSPYVVTDKFTPPVIDSLGIVKTYAPEVNNEPMPEKEKELPYFNKAGLEHFAKVKEKMLQKLLKIDDLLYAKTAPGSTMYKNTEVIVPPFVMANFPVTNLEYKTFLADLVMQGRFEDMKKCLPNETVWNEYGCPTLAKNYFSNEMYNDFPVVNIDLNASMMYCEWLQMEINEQLVGVSSKTSKVQGGGKRKQLLVRLPYDYEWIYAADAAYALIPNCAGYNTIFDPSEGLVDKGFYKRTSQVNKIDKSKETPMDKLSDVNRFGMSEAEMIEIFKKAINYKNVKSKSSGNPAEPALYPDNVEACCLAGHVSELIKSKEGELKMRGCCWQNKDEYLNMLSVFNKNGASPFVGFRVLIITSERGSDKNPFW
ncbi:MAG: SUMF1/EgtB/PvdO family nonheme iron enzyme [Bacteroidetes bacterium]|nr:SUMF1/EgtB/PvdO family nonheme iron enzyme [Bacteroidota bacterium]